MENHKEMRMVHIMRTMLLLVLLALPMSIQAVAYGPNVGEDTIPKHETPAIKPPLEPYDPGEPLEPGVPTVPTNPIELSDSALADPPSPYNSKYSVGAIAGTVSVSNSGAAIYTLKIDAPNGGSLTPQIELSYNSQFSGYGLAGYGFNIAGISVITRGGHDLFHDGKQSGVTYTSSDNLFLDGKRLILQSGNSGTDGAVYTVEGDPFTKVVVHGDYNNSTATTWFEVTTPTGMTYQYGKSTNSRLTYKNKKGYSRIASWYVSQVTDKYSNYITYEYVTYSLRIRPTTITYGRNLLKDRGIINKIIFEYKSLGANARPFAIGDQQGKTEVCLASITTTCSDSVYRQYTFTYNNKGDETDGKWTRLVSVEEKNGKGEKLPPVNFTWQYIPSYGVGTSQLDVPTDNGSSYVSETGKSFLAADLNGDGVSDIIRIAQVEVTTAIEYGNKDSEKATYLYVSISKVNPSGSVTYAPPLIYSLPAVISMKNIKCASAGASVMDYDGDGYNDLVFPMHQMATDYCNHVVFYVILGRDVVVGNAVDNDSFTVDLLSTEKAPLFVTYDIDGDGKDDVVCLEQSKKNNYYPCTIVQHDGTGNTQKRTEVKITLPAGVNKDIEKVFTGDYNNDGLTDLILLYNGGYKIYFNNGGNEPALRFVERNTKSGTNFGNYWKIQQGDFDGDGLVDFVYNRAGESSLWIAHNNGDGTFSFTQSEDIGVADGFSSFDDNRFAISVLDIDHDGRSDVMVSKARYKKGPLPAEKTQYVDTKTRWLVSTGSTLKIVASYTKNREDDANESSIFAGDFDGDGYMELANYGSVLNSSYSTFNERINVYWSGHRLSDIGRIVQVSDAVGNSTSIQYASATSPTVYKKRVTSTYPVNTYTLPLSVVEQITSVKGSAGEQTTKYFYEDLRLHIAGRGMLGFTTMTTDNITLGTQEVTSISEWDKSFWIPAKTKTVVTLGGETSTTESSFSITPVDDGRNYFSFVSESKATDFDGNIVSTISEYDTEKGVPTRQVVNNGADMYKQVDYGDYIQIAGVWMPQTMTATQKHSDDDRTYQNVTKYTYDDFGNVKTMVEGYGKTKPVTTESTFDAYGNLLTRRRPKSGKNITEHYEYDSTGRYVTKAYQTPDIGTKIYAYDIYGNTTEERDSISAGHVLLTCHEYDGWGRRTKTVYPDGNSATFETKWKNGGGYFTREIPSNAPWVRTDYDALGRKRSEKSVGRKDVRISSSIEYNKKGQVVSKTRTEGKLTSTSTFAYDGRGRKTREESTSGAVTTYSYCNRSVTTSNGVQTVTNTYDAWGNVKESDDGLATVAYTYSSNGKPLCISTGGNSVLMEYDDAGNRTAMTDPDAGRTTYSYTADGTILSQRDGRGILTGYLYDSLGRMIREIQAGVSSRCTYYTDGPGRFMLKNRIMSGDSITYEYDRYRRVTKENRKYRSKEYVKEFAYDEKGNLAKVVYPGGLVVTYTYDGYGFLETASANDSVIYRLDSYDGLNESRTGVGRMKLNETLDSYGYLRYKDIRNAKDKRNLALELEFDRRTGNLTMRHVHNLLEAQAFAGSSTYVKTRSGSVHIPDDNIMTLPTGFSEMTESSKDMFEYDSFDRLVSATRNDGQNMTVDYDASGNIVFKTGIGNYTYDAERKPHAVMGVENTDGSAGRGDMYTTYHANGKLERITMDSLLLVNTYRMDGEKWHSELSRNDSIVRSTFYFDNFEEIAENDTTRMQYLLDNGVIVIKRNGAFEYYQGFTDQQGSILDVYDADGSLVFKARYDAWGRQSVSVNEIGLYHGYTGHEMLAEFGLIDMRGRVYDPALGRFLSPDNYVQDPTSSQSFNRYSYCINNPLKYTDPSGDFFLGFISGFVRGLFQGRNPLKTGWQSGINELKIIRGLFEFDSNKNLFGKAWELISRFTWQLPQTFLGFDYAIISNWAWQVDKVDYWGGTTVMSGNNWWQGTGAAMTLGSYILGTTGLEADPNNKVFQHEYGHYLQSQAMGYGYLARVAIPSFISTLKKDGYHKFQPFEQDANRRAFIYFNKALGDKFYKSKREQFQSRGWDFFYNPLDVYHKAETGVYYDYKDAEDRKLLNNLTINTKVFDYFDISFITVGLINGGYYLKNRITW